MRFPFRRRIFWDIDFDKELERIEDEIMQMLKFIAEMERSAEKSLEQARKKDKIEDYEEELTVRGPFVYGVSIKISKDGTPIIRKFGNVFKPEKETIEGEETEKFAYQREPLIDIIENNNTISIIAEVPGVEKNDIQVRTTERILTINVDVEKRKYHKTINLPCDVIPETAKASYKNGILEIKIEKKKKKKDPGVNVKIE